MFPKQQAIRLFGLAFALLLNTAAKPKDQILTNAPNTSTVMFFYQKATAIDGVSFQSNNETIRIWGLQALPKNSPYSFAAKLYLQTLIDKEVSCILMTAINSVKVMQCTTDGTDIGDMLVGAGVAQDLSSESGGYYEEIEKAARQTHLGVWSLSQ